MDLLLTHGYFLADDLQEQAILKPYAPLGLLYLSSYLKDRGADVTVFDTTFRTAADLRACLERERPRVVGIYANLMTKGSVLRVAGAARAVGARVVVGGPDPPPHALEYLEHGAEVVVLGEGEATMAELLPRLLRGEPIAAMGDVAGLAYRGDDGELVRTAPRPLIADLDTLPWPDRRAVDVPSYLAAWRKRHGYGAVSLITARGCPYTCTWCSRSVFGETHRRRSVVSVADEVQSIVEAYRPDQVWYADDVFTIHKGWTVRYADEMARRGLRVPFECISRAERIDDDVARALASLGCRRVWIGSESGSQRILDAMDRRVSVAQIQDTTRILKARGIEAGLFVMLGYEGEELQDLRATVDHLKRAGADTFLTTVAYPIRGTAYHDAVDHRLRTDRDWSERTDRDWVIRGRRTRRYYDFARRWMTGEVAADRHWREGRYLRAVRAATGAGVARLGMAFLSGAREA